MINPNLATFLITIVNIGILFFVLRAILFKPVTKFMEARAKKIQDDIEQAEKDKAQAKLLYQQYEDSLKHAEEEAEVILRSARETAQEQANRIIAEGKAEVENLLAAARKRMEAERNAAMALFKAEAAALVIGASSRLLQREITQDDARQYAARLLQEIGKD
jgi:F-type H+-transporting ATPase subunit b